MVRQKKRRKRKQIKKLNKWLFLKLMLILSSIMLVNVTVFLVNSRSLDVPFHNPLRVNLSSNPKFIVNISQGEKWGSLNGPMQVIQSKGNIYVSDSGNGRVLVFDLDGKFRFEFEKEVKKEKKHLRNPYGLAVDNNGDIYVADMEVGKIFVFDSWGNYIRDFNLDHKYIVKPAGIFIRQDRVYITDIVFHKVYVFDKSGRLIISIGNGSNGKTNNEFYYPNAVVADSTGKIYVADSMNNRIQVFNSKGVFLETFGNGLELYNPRGITINAEGDVFISDSMNGNIKVLDKDGLFLFEIKSSKNYTFYLPTGIYIDQFNNLYVANRGSNQVILLKE